MDSSTSRARRFALWLCAGSLLASSSFACATGAVRTLGHRVERSVDYERAATDGERLWLVYLSEVRNRDGERFGERRRAVVLRLADLAPDAAHPVDRFPLERIRSRDIDWSALRELPLRSSPTDGPAIVVVTDRGVLLHEVDGAPERAVLRAGALTRHYHTLWSYPLLVPAAVWDALVLPQLVVIGIPVFVWDP